MKRLSPCLSSPLRPPSNGRFRNRIDSLGYFLNNNTFYKIKNGIHIHNFRNLTKRKFRERERERERAKTNGDLRNGTIQSKLPVANEKYVENYKLPAMTPFSVE